MCGHLVKRWKKRVHLPKNIETGIVVCGRRHHNAFRVLQEIIPKPANAIQGFMTSHDRFVTRAEAAHIALNAGQIDRPTSSLHSEDLY